jgi:hypothetical protein
MFMNLTNDLRNLISFGDSFLILAACVLLWARYKTSWVSLALAGAVVSALCHVVLSVPEVFAQFPEVRVQMLRFIWPIGSLVFALGLTGHAWTEWETFQRARQGIQS